MTTPPTELFDWDAYRRQQREQKNPLDRRDVEIAPWVPYNERPAYVRPSGVPSGAATFWITALFGLFGLIPALIHSGEARRRNADEGTYWTAFGFGLVVFFAAFFVLFLVVANSGSDY